MKRFFYSNINIFHGLILSRNLTWSKEGTSGGSWMREASNVKRGCCPGCWFPGCWYRTKEQSKLHRHKAWGVQGGRGQPQAGCPNVDYLFSINRYWLLDVSLISIGPTSRFRQEGKCTISPTSELPPSHYGLKCFEIPKKIKLGFFYIHFRVCSFLIGGHP
jgi:hypothetical protein